METKKSKLWEVKQQADTSRLKLYIYSDVEGDSENFFTGEKISSETSAEYFRKTLENFPDVENIDIYINSYGGSVYEGTAIYNQLKRHSAYKTAYIDGFAYSIASVIAMAADKIIMPKNTLMLIHNVWAGVIGNAAELRKEADVLDKYNVASRQAYLSKAGDKLSEERLIEMMDAETVLTAAECVELGLADSFADYEADMTSAEKALEQAKTLGGRAYYRKLQEAAAVSRGGETRTNPNEREIFEARTTEIFENYFNLKGEN